MSNIAILDPEQPSHVQAHAGALTPLDMLNRAVETGANIEVLEQLRDVFMRRLQQVAIIATDERQGAESIEAATRCVACYQVAIDDVARAIQKEQHS